MEESPLIGEITKTERSFSSKALGVVAVGTSLVLAAVVASSALTSAAAGEGAGVFAAASTEASAPRSISVSNAYERSLGIAIGDGLYPFENLVEMYQTTLIKPDTSALGNSYVWVAEGVEEDVDSLTVKVGSTAEFEFTHLGKHKVRVYESDAAAVTFLDATDGASITATTVKASDAARGAPLYVAIVTTKYVRRELRDLTETDREAYFDALVTVYRTSQSEGEAKYGADFMSGDWLVRQHLEGAAQMECDHWHDDAGFLNHHVGITLQMEKSMRLVNPRTCSHYWDYTLDALRQSVLGVGYWNSEIFHDEWFGSAAPNNEHHIVAQGRFAYLSVLEHAESFSNITNPHGLLRSPWNTNAVPYLLRSNEVMAVKTSKYTLPTCTAFEDAINSTGITHLNYVLYMLNGALHGPVHIMLGGQWGFEKSFTDKFNLTVDGTSVTPITDNFLLGSKFLWRQGYVRCPETCDGGDSWRAAEVGASSVQETSACSCSCPEEVWPKDEAGAAVSPARFLNNISGVKDLWGSPSLKMFKDLYHFSEKDITDMMCHVGHPGEMFTSAAPQDPTFWPLHGLAERFVQLLRFKANTGDIELDETWGYNHDTVLSDTRLVCDWSATEKGSYDMPTCKTAATCPGHRGDDLLPFEYVLGKQGKQYYTNQEFYDLLGPWSEELPYVYDKLSTWPACEGGTIIADTNSSDTDDMITRV